MPLLSETFIGVAFLLVWATVLSRRPGVHPLVNAVPWVIGFGYMLVVMYGGMGVLDRAEHAGSTMFNNARILAILLLGLGTLGMVGLTVEWVLMGGTRIAKPDASPQPIDVSDDIL